MKLRGFFCLLSVLTIGTSGCSVLSSLNPFDKKEVPAKAEPGHISTPNAAATSPDLPQSVATPDKPSSTEAIELIWKAPSESLIAYHVHYGSDPQKLEHHLRIPIAQLEKITHPTAGISYRLKLQLPAQQTKLFVAMQAESEGGISPMTTPMELTKTEVKDDKSQNISK